MRTCDRCGDDIDESLRQYGKSAYCEKCLPFWVLIEETTVTLQSSANDYHKQMYADIEEWRINATKLFMEMRRK